MPKIFHVEQVPGSKRVSDRDYTHAVIARWDRERYVADLAKRLEADDCKTSRSNFAYSRQNADAVAGQLVTGDYHYAISQTMIDEGKKTMDACSGTWPGYLAMLQAQTREQTAANLKKDTGAFKVLQWSMTQAAAAKSIGSHSKAYLYHKDVQVVPVTRVK